ncbi:hypothetical protein ACGFZP_26565 [Kitasatospora sp. NPDC048239]|uniref:hypothetical protein n=1 Tax=Kitasatospora sp. NPDC048239 TaxID=3364046 RepID=UPI003722505E
MAEKVYSIIEVAQQDGRWGYSDINFAEGRTAGSGSGAGPVWRQISPLPLAGSGLAAAGSAEDQRRVYYQESDRSVVGAVYDPSSPDGHWAGYRVFTTEIGAPSAAVGSALAVTGRIGGLRVYYLDGGPLGDELLGDGRLDGSRLDGGRHPVRLEERDGEWTFSVCTVAPPASLISPLAAVTTEQGEYAYYLDGQGHLVEVSWLGAEGWSVCDLTSAVEGCPAPSPLSRLAVAGRGSGVRLVYFLDGGNRPVQLEHTVIEGTKKRPEGGVLWQVCELSAYGAPAAAAGSQPAVVLGVDGHPRLYYLDAGRMVVGVEYNGRGWDVRHAGVDADSGAGAPPAAAGGSLAAVAGPDGSDVRVYYLGAADAGAGPEDAGAPEGDHDLIELSGSGDKWTSLDLGAELDLPDVATGVPSPFAASCTSGPRVYYTSEE